MRAAGAVADVLLAALVLVGCRGPDPTGAGTSPTADPLGGVESTLDALERDVTAGE